jgi:hypothetical protein
MKLADHGESQKDTAPSPKAGEAVVLPLCFALTADS